MRPEFLIKDLRDKYGADAYPVARKLREQALTSGEPDNVIIIWDAVVSELGGCA
jgi:hypothetical protein